MYLSQHLNSALQFVAYRFTMTANLLIIFNKFHIIVSEKSSRALLASGRGKVRLAQLRLFKGTICAWSKLPSKSSKSVHHQYTNEYPTKARISERPKA
jgi:hypothetical protein